MKVTGSAPRALAIFFVLNLSASLACAHSRSHDNAFDQLWIGYAHKLDAGDAQGIAELFIPSGGYVLMHVLPNSIPDPATGGYTENYLFHHYYEVFLQGRREVSPLYTEEIVSKEIEYVDFQGNLGGMCIFWSVYDWDAPQYQPTEEPNFIARYGEDNPFRSHKFYSSDDKDNFSRIRSQMLAALPMPRRYIGKIRGPRGSQVFQRWHVGNMWQPNPADRWEDYWGNEVHTL
jgi:hypothetical protein